MTQQSITNVESHPPAGPVSRIFGQYDRSLFWPVLLIYGLIMACALFFPTLTGQVLSSTRDFLIFNFGWGFLLGMGGALLFCLYLVISPYGDLKLGADDEVPEFSYGAWISMLFSCGFGIGFGVKPAIKVFLNCRPRKRSIALNCFASSSLNSEIATPLEDARPVRPIL